MRIKDIKAGGWVRTGDNIGRPELLKVTSFSYDRSCVNGYCFHFRGLDYGLLLERKDFKYSDNVGDLIKKNEQILEHDGNFIICKGYSKDEFIKHVQEEKPKEIVEVEITTKEYDHADAIRRATENLCGEEE